MVSSLKLTKGLSEYNICVFRLACHNLRRSSHPCENETKNNKNNKNNCVSLNFHVKAIDIIKANT